jgi:hypothetical protein
MMWTLGEFISAIAATQFFSSSAWHACQQYLRLLQIEARIVDVS